MHKFPVHYELSSTGRIPFYYVYYKAPAVGVKYLYPLRKGSSCARVVVSSSFSASIRGDNSVDHSNSSKNEMKPF